MTSIRVLPAALLVMAACSGDSTAPSTDALDLDVAVVAGDAAYEDVSMMRTQLGAFGVPTIGIGRTGEWQGCPFDGARFTCAPVARGPFTMTRSYAFKDAAGVAQSAYDAALTASANFVSGMTGAAARDRWSATVSRQREMTVTGLLGNETQHTINGVGTSSETRSQHSGDGASRSYGMTSTVTYTNIVVPFPRARGTWPLSGSITRVVVAVREGRQGSTTHTRTATVTFDGDETALLVVGDRRFTLDLGTGRVTPIA
jgi:hypothetical protein